jgi:hypothetical protein
VLYLPTMMLTAPPAITARPEEPLEDVALPEDLVAQHDAE